MNKDEHVYCTDCIRGKQMIADVLQGKFIFQLNPICQDCWPYDFPDSRAFELRKNYEARKNEQE